MERWHQWRSGMQARILTGEYGNIALRPYVLLGMRRNVKENTFRKI